MARADYEAWIPVEYDPTVISRMPETSQVEAVARHVPMATATKSIPRSSGSAVGVVAKGGAYGEDTSLVDDVILQARKIAEAKRIAEEDLEDSLADILTTNSVEFGTSYAKYFDNATLATTAAANGTTVPFNSVYYSLTQANSDTGYVANSNILKTAAGVPVNYNNLSDVFGLVETGDWFDVDSGVVIAHPSFRSVLREVKDSQGRPIFIQGLAGTPDTLFGAKVLWSKGARTSAVATATPAGNPILVVISPDLLIVGDRSGLETMFIDGDTGVGALTDEAIQKFRARKGFAIGNEEGFAVLEVVPSA